MRARQNERRDRFAFMTHNKSDFSIENGNQKIATCGLRALSFRASSRSTSSIWPEALRRVDPSLVTDHDA